MRRLYVTQGIEHIKTILQHGDKKSTTGILIRSLIQAHKVEIGTGKDFFRNDWTTIRHYATRTWLTNTMEFMFHNSMYIQEETENLKLQCQKDQFIMDVVHTLKLTPRELKNINMCRIYMRVSTIADISDGFGKKSWMAISRGHYMPTPLTNGRDKTGPRRQPGEHGEGRCGLYALTKHRH